MKKNYPFLLFIILTINLQAQNFSEFWEGHFSYREITDVVQGNGKVFAASENAIFSFDVLSTEILTYTTIDGLSGGTIARIHLSENFNYLIVGYEDGLLEIMDLNDNSVLTIVDIINKPTIPPDLKKINHFLEFNEFIYISTDYGISVYNLQNLEFGDTYFIGNGGAQQAVYQTAIYNDFIFAAMGPNGMKRADAFSTDLIDYQEWQFIYGTNFRSVEAIEDKLYAYNIGKKMFDISTGALTEIFTYPSLPVEHKTEDGKMIVTTVDEVYIYDSQFNLLSFHSVSPEYDFDFTSSSTLLDEVFIGTIGSGVLNATFQTPAAYIDIFPDGPLKNDAFKVQANSGILWVSFGGYSPSYNPSPSKAIGLSQYQNEQWNNIPFDSLFAARNLNAISFNPSNPNQVFVSSFWSGLVELNNGEPTILYDNTNSGLESLVLPNNPDFVNIRVSGSTFDNEGLLWTVTSKVQRPLKSYNPENGQWQAYDFTEIIPNGLTSENGFGDVVVGANGTKWIGARRSGLIGFNEGGSGGQQLKNINDEDISNLPDRTVQALAMDNRNQLWIGTIKGLRVLYNTANFFEDDAVRTEAIIILEDGIPKELLQFQFISDIKVDGGNNKWVGTVGSGAFYFTSDGQETIYHFTTANSPLPSNNVNDITVDNSTGRVFFATDRGLVSFRSGSSKPQDDLQDAFVYPNPVRPGYDFFEKKIKIQNISENVNIKITDIEGNLVAEAQSNRNQRFKGYNLEIDGGTAFWNGKNLVGTSVASGVYLIMLNDLDTLETRVIKLMVVR